MRLHTYLSKMDKPMLMLSFLFVIVFMAQLFVDDASPISATLEFLNWTIWAIFALDYLICLFLSEDKKDWILKHPLELLIVLVPFLRPLRIFRAIPVVIKLFQKSRNTLSGQALRIAVIGMVFLIVPATLIMFAVEGPTQDSKITSWGDAIWWAVATSTTVGYGDIYPVTPVGKIVSALVMVLGITFIGILTASIASWFVRENQDESESELAQVLVRLERIEQELKHLRESK